MKFEKASLILALLNAGASAAPRGAGENVRIRGREERKLQQMDGMEAGAGAAGPGGDAGDGGDAEFTGLSEWHNCEADPAAAIAYVDAMGRKDLGSLECYADPVNGCSDGCCRFGVYFICDTTNFAPHLPCVCNNITAAVPSSASAPIATVPATMAPVASTGATMAPVASTGNTTMEPVTTGATLAPVSMGVTTAPVTSGNKTSGPVTTGAAYATVSPNATTLETTMKPNATSSGVTMAPV